MFDLTLQNLSRSVTRVLDAQVFPCARLRNCLNCFRGNLKIRTSFRFPARPGPCALFAESESDLVLVLRVRTPLVLVLRVRTPPGVVLRAQEENRFAFILAVARGYGQTPILFAQIVMHRARTVRYRWSDTNLAARSVAVNRNDVNKSFRSIVDSRLIKKKKKKNM